MLDTDHFITCTADRPDDFVELQVQCTSVPILSVLDQKNDEKRDNRGRGLGWVTMGPRATLFISMTMGLLGAENVIQSTK